MKRMNHELPPWIPGSAPEYETLTMKEEDEKNDWKVGLVAEGLETSLVRSARTIC